ncbi:MAG: hypothetical protein ACFFCD_17020 [Promethearchaeota archaeon]
MKTSLNPLKYLKLKQWLDHSDFKILSFIIASILLYWLFYGTISYFFAISAPLVGIVFIAAIHLFVVLGSVLLITHVRRRFLRLSSHLQDERVPIEELSEKILIPPEKIRSAIMDFKKEGIISGVLDGDKNVYLNINRDQWNKARDLLVEHKKISTENFAKHFEVSKSEAKYILLELQNQKMVQGYFIEENREFITQEWIYDTFRESIEKYGRINLNKTKQRLGLTDETVQHEFNNFIRVENVSGFYFGKNEFVKFEEHAENTFLEEIKDAGSILLNDLSAKFNLSEDYCKYLITESRSKGLLNGVFSENKRLFITLDSLREFVISAIQQDGSLTLFAKDFAIPYDVLYTTILRNFNFEDLIESTGVNRDALENILYRLLTEKGE